MKKSSQITLSTLALTFVLVSTASANEIFKTNCSSCHAGGNNIMNPDKTLKMESLEKNGVNSLGAIKALVSKGKAPMPAFASTLDEKEIDAVSAYVLEQAKKGW
jgi:cytochrome c6